jgi:uncharacterized protein
MTPGMNILLTGAGGLIGSALKPALESEGHRVIPLRRAPGNASAATWRPEAGEIRLAEAGPFQAVVHLAGESIAQRWTPPAREKIRQSRVEGTRLLAEALAGLPDPPRVLVCASAVGFYGNRGDEVLDERSSAGGGFLAEICRAWEAAAAPAVARGVRVAHLRLGVVLTPGGGALKAMLPAFRLGLGGRLGSGRQYWSWIALEDVLGAICHTLAHEGLVGPVNAVAPGSVTQTEFARALASALHRPAVLPVPAAVIRALLGQMGEEALLASARVRPSRLIQTGFQFRFPQIEPALRALLARPAAASVAF